MKKTICLVLSSLFFLTSCSKAAIEEQEKNTTIFDVPEYTINEYNLTDEVSCINQIGYENGELCASGFYTDESMKIIEENISSKDIITEFDVVYSSDSEKGEYFNHSYYERGVQYNESGENNSEVELKISGSNDAKNHYWISDLYQFDGGNIVYLVFDADRKYYIITCNSKNQIIDKKKIKIPDECSANSIYYYEDKYYICAYQIELLNGEKSYPSSIFILDNNFNVKDEIVDIDIEHIKGLIYLNADRYAVYSYDEENNITCLEVSDGDITTFSDIKKFEGRVRFFPSDKKDSVYVTDNKKAVLYNISSDESELVAEIQGENNKIYEILYCDGVSFAYAIKNDNQISVNIIIDEECNYVRSDNQSFDYEYYQNSEGKYVVSDITDDSEIVFNDYDGDAKLTYFGDLFWGVSSTGKTEIYDLDGNLKFICGKKEYHTEKLLLSGCNPSVVYKINDKYYFGTINSENGEFENITEIKGKTYLPNAETYYSGDEKYLFYVQVNGYIFGYDSEGRKYTPVVDLAEVKNDSPLLFIRNITDGVFQLITENKIYKLTEKDEDNVSKQEIVVGNISYENLYPILCSDNFSEYAVKIVDYGDEDTGEINYAGLNQDIISGNSPDIIVSSSYTDVTYLENMDYFAQIDKSEIFDQDKDYLDNIINAFNTGDYIYRIPVGFKINTLVSYSDNINANWSYNDYLNLIKAGSIAGDKHSLWGCCESLYSPEFINSPDMKLNLYSENFKEIIRIIKEYASELDSESSFFDLLHGELIGPDSCNMEDEKKYYICGYPSINSGVSYVHSDVVLSVSKNSSCIKECFEFIKKAISLSYGQSFYLETAAFNDQINYMKSNTDIEFANEIQSIIMNAAITDKRNSAIEGIIDEGVDEYFETDVSADEAVEKIVNKILLYFNETK